MKHKPFSNSKIAHQILLLLSASVLILEGCTSVAFRTEANHFSSAYGDVLNEQMLLNLARLDNGHPAYFVAVGTLNSKWNLGTTATGGLSRNQTDTTTTTDGSVVTGGVLGLANRMLQTVSGVVVGKSAGAGLEGRVQPEFQLIPLNNEQLAQQVLQPTRSDAFYTLYEQGFPIDVLMRVLVEEIRTTIGGSDWVARNEPPAPDQDLTGIQAKLFTRFLGVCQIARDLQRTGHLKVEKTKPLFVSLGGDAIETAPNPEIIMKTQQGGASWEKQDGGWKLGRQQSSLKFVIDGSPDAAMHAVIREGNVEEDGFVNQVVGILATTVGVQGRTTVTEQQVTHDKVEQIERIGADDSRKVRLVLRSFSRVLDAVAREQNVFPRINGGYSGHAIPTPQFGPVIKTKWENSSLALTPPIGAVRYGGTRYTVADPKKHDQRSPTWNRDVFRMLVALNSQVAVDISKFQRQVLEVR